MMPANVFKDTAGRTLVGFAVLVLGVAAATVQDWWTRTDLEWPELPTGVEDQDLFRPSPAGGGGAYQLAFWAAPDGLRRAGTKPRLLRDFRMRKLVDPRFEDSRRFTRDSSGRYFVYRYDKDGVDPATGLPERVFLKAGRDHYVAFSSPAGAAGGGLDSDLRDPGVPATPSARSGS